MIHLLREFRILQIFMTTSEKQVGVIPSHNYLLTLKYLRLPLSPKPISKEMTTDLTKISKNDNLGGVYTGERITKPYLRLNFEGPHTSYNKALKFLRWYYTSEEKQQPLKSRSSDRKVSDILQRNLDLQWNP